MSDHDKAPDTAAPSETPEDAVPADLREHDTLAEAEEQIDSLLTKLARPRVRNPALIVAAGVLALLLWQSDESRSPAPDFLDLRGEREPDGFVSGARHLAFNEDGQRVSMITSPRIEQFDDTGTATLQEPAATLYEVRTQTPWDIRARSGVMDQNAARLELQGEVQVTRQVRGGASTLETEQLTIDNALRQVFTDEPVVVSGPGMVTRARGMRGWIDDRVLEFDTDVEGRYEAENH